MPLLLAPTVACRKADAFAGGVAVAKRVVEVPGVITAVCRWAEGVATFLEAAGLFAGADRADEEDAAGADSLAARDVPQKSSAEESLLESLKSSYLRLFFFFFGAGFLLDGGGPVRLPLPPSMASALLWLKMKAEAAKILYSRRFLYSNKSPMGTIHFQSKNKSKDEGREEATTAN